MPLRNLRQHLGLSTCLQNLCKDDAHHFPSDDLDQCLMDLTILEFRNKKNQSGGPLEKLWHRDRDYKAKMEMCGQDKSICERECFDAQEVQLLRCCVLFLDIFAQTKVTFIVSAIVAAGFFTSEFILSTFTSTQWHKTFSPKLCFSSLCNHTPSVDISLGPPKAVRNLHLFSNLSSSTTPRANNHWSHPRSPPRCYLTILSVFTSNTRKTPTL